MHSAPSTAPWQVEPVGVPGRIAAAALAALALDSVFTWQATAHVAEALVLTTIPILVAIRVVRGFPGSLAVASLTFLGAQIIAAHALGGGRLRPVQPSAALAVAMAISAIGLATVVLHLVRTSRSRQPVIAIATPDEGSLAVARRRSP